MPQSATIEVREHTGTLWPAVVAAVLSRGWTHPLDTFRVSRAGVPGTLVRSLYAGFPIGVALATPGTVAYLTTYTAVSKRVRAAELPPVVAHAVGATVAEMVAGVFFVPMEVLKQRQQLGLAGYGTLVQAVASTPRRDFYRGYGTSLLAFVPFSVLYFTFYEAATARLKAVDFRARFGISVVCAAAAASVTTPLDVVRIRYQAEMGHVGGASGRSGVLASVARIWRAEGARAFVAGFWPRILWASANTGAVVGLYDVLQGPRGIV